MAFDSIRAVPLVAAVVSAVTALLVAAITSALTRRREREADWRRLKLERYQELVVALSGIVKERSTAEAQSRFADACNSLNYSRQKASYLRFGIFRLTIPMETRTRTNGSTTNWLVGFLVGKFI